MADITMCSGVGCPMKDTCYRHNAAADTRQSYFMEPPIDSETEECHHYWIDRDRLKWMKEILKKEKT